jgi:hypothetical protein
MVCTFAYCQGSNTASSRAPLHRQTAPILRALLSPLPGCILILANKINPISHTPVGTHQKAV